MNNPPTAVGAVHLRRNELELAAKELEQAIALRTAALGEDNPQVASAISNLGAVRIHQREFDAAKALLEQLDRPFDARVVGPGRPGRGHAPGQRNGQGPTERFKKA